MYSPHDTIVAIATPVGRGGIGVVRISGPGSAAAAAVISERTAALEPRRATLTRILVGGTAVDRAVLVFFPAPHSYTGEDVLEISAHGSPVLLNAIVEAALAAGVRLAEPGEFTFRAYLHGRIDLVQAEAVNDLVDAVTPLQARAAFDQLEGTLTSRIGEIDRALFDVSARLEASLDFAGEGYHFIDQGHAAAEIAEVADAIDDLLADAHRGRLVREGAQVAIVGRPNTGKSSVFNRLLGSARAIVTDIPGTTRDLLSEVISMSGMPVTLIDTAGLRADAADRVEVEGMSRAHAARDVADVTLVVLDRSRALSPDDEQVLSVTSGRPRVVAANKSDLTAAWDIERAGAGVVCISAADGSGFDALRAALVAALGAGERLRDTPALTNVRHADLLSRAGLSLRRASAAAQDGTPEEFVASDVTEARALLEEVTGRRTADDVLQAIFSRFCIGK